jgi:hypothetical protein
LRDVSSDQIQNIEQKSRTTPLGSTKHGKSELFRYDRTVRICFLLLLSILNITAESNQMVTLGGGCALNAKANGKSIWDLDERFCIHAKATLEFLIWDLFEQIKKDCIQ